MRGDALRTTRYEACFYVDTVPLMLAFVGLARRPGRALAPWLLIVPVSLALATMPMWWPSGYATLLNVPFVGYFRAPARYTLLASLGLALLAGRCFDHAVSVRRTVAGLGLAAAFTVAAAVWAWQWAGRPAAPVGTADPVRVFGWSAMAWLAGGTALVSWRRGWAGPIVPLLVAVLELGALYYDATTVWGRAVELPRESQALQRHAEETGPGTVGGRLGNLAVHVGRAATYPLLGMGLPPLTSVLHVSLSPETATEARSARLLRRVGMSHGIWHAPVQVPGAEILYAGPDEALDGLAFKPPGTPDRATWYLVWLPGGPPAHVAVKARGAPDARTLPAYLADDETTDTAWFLGEDRPPDVPGPRARAARLLWRDGLTGEVEHDGTCDLVVRRAYAPGWTARLDDVPSMPVSRVDLGLQSVRLSGTGRTRISLRYEPPLLWHGVAVSVATLALVLFELARAARVRRGDEDSRS